MLLQGIMYGSLISLTFWAVLTGKQELSRWFIKNYIEGIRIVLLYNPLCEFSPK